MLKKEVKEVIKQILVFLIIVISLPIIITLVSSMFGTILSIKEVFFFIYQVGLMIFSVFMGTSLFSKDRADGGMEYMFTLPYSRFQLLGIKLAPRFISVLAAFVLYLVLLYITGINPEITAFMPLLPTGILAFICLSLFILGVPFSTARGSIIISGLAAMFAFLVYLGIVHLFFPAALVLKGREVHWIHTLLQNSWSVPGYLYFSASALLLASLISFVYAFKRLHLGPSWKVFKRYFKMFIPIFIIVFMVSLFWAVAEIQEPRKTYFLTETHHLIESQYTSARIYDKTGVKQITEGPYFWGYNSIEKGDYVYTFYRSRYATQLVRMNLRDPNYSIEVVYNVKGKAYVRNLNMYKDVCVFFEIKRKEHQRIYYLVVVKPETGTFRKMIVNEADRVDIYPFLIGAGETAGKRSWLLYYGFYQEWEIMRIWEDGHIDRLGTTNIRPVYVQGKLITANGGSIIFNQLTPAGMEEIKKIPGIKGLYFFQIWTRHLEQHAAKEIYGGVRGKESYLWKKIFKLDLQTLEMEEVNQLENSTGYIRYSTPDNCYYIGLKVDEESQSIKFEKIYRVEQGKVEVLKEFEPVVFHRGKDFFEIYEAGMVLRQGGKTSVYSLPGVKKIEFKELE